MGVWSVLVSAVVAVTLVTFLIAVTLGRAIARLGVDDDLVAAEVVAAARARDADALVAARSAHPSGDMTRRLTAG